MEVRDMKSSLVIIPIALALILVIAAACGTNSADHAGLSAGKAIKTVTVGNLKATLSNSTGQLKPGSQEVTLAFTDSTGKPVDVGAVSLNFHMPSMPSLVA